MAIFNSYVTNYQRVTPWFFFVQRCSTAFFIHRPVPARRPSRPSFSSKEVNRCELPQSKTKAEAKSAKLLRS